MVYLSACKTDSLAKFPNFSFRLSDSTTIINTKAIPTDKPIILISFESDCRDCQQTTDSLLQQISALKDVRFYFLSMESMDKVRQFRDYYQLNKFPNIIIGQDDQRIAAKYYKVRGTPFIALYNSDKQLAGIYQGKPQVQELIASIKQLY